ncbi:MAG: DinB family protein [Ignavibacteriaceae bacterium]|jgi:hypothetical protein
MINRNIISEGIREVVAAAKPELLKIPPENAVIKASPDKWSKKEILGHLIDSAANNHQRFVRAAQSIAADFPPYNQNRWVEVQSYNKLKWQDIIELFYQYNIHISNVIDFLPEEVLTNSVNIGKENPVTLEFVITDYLRHLKHHVEQLNG